MRILLASDGSTGASVAEALLCSLTWPAGTEVEVVMVVGPRPPPPFTYALLPDLTAYEGSMRADAASVVGSAAERIAAFGLATKACVLRGRTVDRLVEHGLATDASLIICGSRGHGRLRTGLFGSVGRAVAGQARSSVLIARQSSATRVVLASDGSGASWAAEQTVLWWPAFAGLPIDLVRAVRDTPDLTRQTQPAAQQFAGTMARLRARGRDAREIVLVGEPASKVLGHAAEACADLIVVGTHDRSGVARLWYGSVSDQIAAQGRSSVLIARDRDASSDQRRRGSPVRAWDFVLDIHPRRHLVGDPRPEV